MRRRAARRIEAAYIEGIRRAQANEPPSPFAHGDPEHDAMRKGWHDEKALTAAGLPPFPLT